MRITNSSPNHLNEKAISAWSSAPIKPETIPDSKSDVEKLMQELKSIYKNLDFDFLSFEDTEKLQDYALSHTGNNHVVLSKELLEKMTADESLCTKIKHVLDSFHTYQVSAQKEAQRSDKTLLGMGLVLDENGTVSKWTATQEKARKQEHFPVFQPQESKPSSILDRTKKKRKRPLPCLTNIRKATICHGLRGQRAYLL